MTRLAPAPLALAATLAFTSLIDSKAGAATVQSFAYSTDGNIDNQTGVAPITFIPASNQTLTMPGTFSLGQFDAANILPTSATLTFNNTPFTVDLNVASGTGSGTYTYMISGNFNGSITGAGTSDMVATVSSITGVPSLSNGIMTTPPFPVSELQVAVPQGINAPNASLGSDGVTTLYAQVSPTALPIPSPIAAPEPATLAIFAAALIACGVRGRLARSKSLATA